MREEQKGGGGEEDAVGGTPYRIDVSRKIRGVMTYKSRGRIIYLQRSPIISVAHERPGNEKRSR